MPNLDTGWILKTTSSGYAKATAEINGSNLNNTTFRVTANGRCFGDTIIQNGVRCTIGHNTAGSIGARSATNTGVLNRGDWVAACSGTWDFTRLYAPYNIGVYAQFNGETVGGYYGFYRGSDGYYGPFSASGTLTVPVCVASSGDNPSSCANTRNSDTQNTVSWVNGNASADKTTYIEREVDVSGIWAQIGTAGGTSTSYVDKTTSANHSYRYRVRSGWGDQLTAYATSGTTYNTPAEPGKPTCSRNPDNSITAVFTNTGITQTDTELAQSTDGINWTTVKTQTGTNVTSINHAPGGGTFYYRVRNIRGVLVSPWSVASAPVVTIIPPAAPTLISPTSGAIIKTSDAGIVFEWTHNPLDGSAQTAAQLEYSLTGAAPFTVVQINSAAKTYTLANSFAVNSTVTWRVRTKGADANYGAYSSTSAFKVYQTPMAAITSPGATPITILPLTVSWSYSDLSGTQEQATVQIRSSDGVVLFSRSIQGVATSTLITSSDYLPANKESYRILLSVRSTTSLTSTTEGGFSTNYLEPALPIAMLEFDEQKASVSLSVFKGEDANLPATVSCGILRQRKDGTLLALADHVASGTAVTDIYPPLDEELVYLFAAYAASGVASIVKETVIIPSKMTAFINFGDDLRQLAKVALDSSWNKSLNHSKEVFESAGVNSNDSYPLVFYGVSKQLAGSLSGTAPRSAELIGTSIQHNLISDIDALSDWTGSVVLRLPYEPPIPATLTVSQAVSSQYLSGISIAWERVRGYGMAL